MALLLQDEILGRENHKFKARIKRANIRGDKTLETFDFDFNSKINRAQIQELASCRFVNEKSPVLIVGPTGTGKSHIAQALSHCAIRQGIDVLWLSQTKLFGELQAARAAGRYEKFVSLQKYRCLSLTILGSDRSHKMKTSMTDIQDMNVNHSDSNLDFNEWGEAFPNRLLAAATLDRLRHNAHRIILDGTSFRAGHEDKLLKETKSKKST